MTRTTIGRVLVKLGGYGLGLAILVLTGFAVYTATVGDNQSVSSRLPAGLGADSYAYRLYHDTVTNTTQAGADTTVAKTGVEAEAELDAETAKVVTRFNDLGAYLRMLCAVDEDSVDEGHPLHRLAEISQVANEVLNNRGDDEGYLHRLNALLEEAYVLVATVETLCVRQALGTDAETIQEASEQLEGLAVRIGQLL